MKLFTCRQIAEIDRMTMQLEPIASIDLMERASEQIAGWMIENLPIYHPILVFAGPGNNGGDALAVARMLAQANYKCTVFLVSLGRELRGDPAENWHRLLDQNKILVKKINSTDDFPAIPENSVILDGLFGSGLNKPLEGLAAQLVRYINQSGTRIISIDIPSGLFGEDNSGNTSENIVRANQTLTLQFPKLSFLLPENEVFVGNWTILPIGLHPNAIDQVESPYQLLTTDFISEKIKKRSKFSHKGTFGHALLISGSYGKMGAAVLASKACLRAGVGLVTCHIPQRGYDIMQTSVPEAMISIDPSEINFSKIPGLETFSAIGIGPGLGKKTETSEAFEELLLKKPGKLVIDADALNILSENRRLLELLPPNVILTPHPKEFERLIGLSQNSFSRMQQQIRFSRDHQAIVILKGAHTSISFPDGRIAFNTTGNPGMATAGSGDVLTGIVLGLLAQNYPAEEAAMLGVFLHGLAGDLARKYFGENALIAGDIIGYLGKAFLQLE